METNCPVCNNCMNIEKGKEGKIITCNECESSLFVSKILKSNVKFMPFQIIDPKESVLENEYTENEYEEDEYDAE